MSPLAFRILLVIYQCSEAISWTFCECGICPQFLFHISFNLIALYADVAFCIVILIILIICVILLISSISYPKFTMGQNSQLFLILLFFALVPFATIEFKKIESRINTVDDKVSVDINNKVNDDDILSISRSLRDMFIQPVQILEKAEKLKNVLIINVESLELGMLSPYLTKYPNALPNLSKIWQNSTRFTNTDRREQIWSIKSHTMVQCGIPFIDERSIDFLANSYYVNGKRRLFPCASEYFKAAGYETNVFYGDRGGYDQDLSILFKNHNGIQLFNYFNRDTLKYLGMVLQEREKDGKLFYYMVILEDTHPPQFRVDSACKRSLKKQNFTKMWRSFNCMDDVTSEFLNSFKKNKLFENTVVMLMGDHPIQGFYDKNDFEEVRNMLYMFPYGESKEYTHYVSPYDITPTLLELAGIKKYAPVNPFGHSMFDSQSSRMYPVESNYVNEIYSTFRTLRVPPRSRINKSKVVLKL